MRFSMPGMIRNGCCMSGRTSGRCDGLLMSGSECNEDTRKRIGKKIERIDEYTVHRLLLHTLTRFAYSASLFCLLSVCISLAMKIPPYLG